MKQLITCLIFAATLSSCDELLVGSEKVLYARSQSFDSNPIEERLRELLNTQTDSDMGYLKMALVGEAFGKHPEQFKRLARDLKTEKERVSYQWLREWGSGIFEHYPERKPEAFDRIYSEATWLKPRTE